jgi:hypothetical protein
MSAEEAKASLENPCARFIEPTSAIKITTCRTFVCTSFYAFHLQGQADAPTGEMYLT